MKENEKVIQALADEELMDLVGGFRSADILRKYPSSEIGIIREVEVIRRPPNESIALYSISPIFIDLSE